MISFTREIDEKILFEDLINHLFKMETFDGSYMCMVEDLPKEVQRLIFSKVGAMMIDYAGSEEF